MRFVDANIYIYASLKTERKLSEKDLKLKSVSKLIVDRIDKNEKVLISAVHISEISNVLEDIMPLNALEAIESILMNENVQVAEVDKEIYTTALELAKMLKISINDCVASVIMKTYGIDEIYSFDSDFDKIDGITRIEK